MKLLQNFKKEFQNLKMKQMIINPKVLIGVTALHYGYAIGTRNVRHFQMIPGLNVIAL